MSPKRKAEKRSDICYVCEWQGCTKTVFDDLVLYLQHVKHHSLNSMKGREPSAAIEASCGWTGCFENQFKSVQSYRVHVSFHAFHCKLMSWGDEALSQLKKSVKGAAIQVECRRDPSDRCLLPELPDEFVCFWEDCFTNKQTYEDAEAFYRHVDTHAMDIAIPSLSKEVLKTTRFATCRWLTPSDNPSGNEACNLSFLSKSHLKNHLRSHSQEKTIACSTCGAMFSDKTKFSDHILRQLEPEGDSRYICTLCNVKFVTERLLNEHMKKHSNSIMCSECGKLSTCTAEHNKHYSFRHSNERPFDCKFCDSRFKSKVDLRRHIYIHNGENSFKCSVDGCAFESRCQSSLTRHQKKIHSNQPLNEYECHECKAKFSRGSNLTKHLIGEHNYFKSESISRFKYNPDPVTGIFHLSPFFHSATSTSH